MCGKLNLPPGLKPQTQPKKKKQLPGREVTVHKKIKERRLKFTKKGGEVSGGFFKKTARVGTGPHQTQKARWVVG